MYLQYYFAQVNQHFSAVLNPINYGYKVIQIEKSFEECFASLIKCGKLNVKCVRSTRLPERELNNPPYFGQHERNAITRYSQLYVHIHNSG